MSIRTTAAIQGILAVLIFFAGMYNLPINFLIVGAIVQISLALYIVFKLK